VAEEVGKAYSEKTGIQATPYLCRAGDGAL
jgi:hypothetical protein